MLKVSELKNLKEFFDYVEFYYNCGFSVIPAYPNEKRPMIKWQDFQNQRLSLKDLIKLFNQTNQIGIVTGKFSKLIILDCDTEESFTRVKSIVDVFDKDYLITKTPKGYHIWLIYDGENKFNSTRIVNKDGIAVDIKAEGGFVIVPPSQIKDKKYEFIFSNIKNSEILPIFSSREVYSIFQQIKFFKISTKEEVDEKDYKEFNQINCNLEEIKDNLFDYKLIYKALDPIYIKGNRDFIIFGLSGLLAKTGIMEDKAKELVTRICEYFNDEEHNQRLKVVERTYKMFRLGENIQGYSMLDNLGIDMDKLLKGLFGKNLVSKKVKEEFIDTLKNTLESYEEEMSNVRLFVSNRDIFVIHPEKGIVLMKKRGKSFDEEIVLKIFPLEVKIIRKVQPSSVYHDSLEIELVYIIPGSHTLKGQKFYVRGNADQIINKLHQDFRITALRHRSEKSHSAISLLVDYFIQIEGLKVEYPFGIFRDRESNNLIINHPYYEDKWKTIKIDKMRIALQKLNKIAKFFRPQLFRDVMLYGTIAPFSFLLKEKHIPIRYLFLNGPAKTGKTTLAELLLGIYNLSNDFSKGSGSIDTVPRLGEVYNHSTFPTIINEPLNAFRNYDVVEVLKSSYSNLVAREILIQGRNPSKIFAYSYLIFTSNKLPILDDALKRRLHILDFSFQDRPENQEKAQELHSLVYGTNLYELKEIGKFFLQNLWNEIKDCEYEGEILEKTFYLWKRLYREYKVDLPEWLKGEFKLKEFYKVDINDDVYASVLSKVKEKILENISKHRLPSVYEGGFSQALKVGGPFQYRGDKVLFYATVLEDWNLPVSNLQTFADIIGGIHIPELKIKHQNKYITMAVVEVETKMLYDLLFGMEEVKETTINKANGNGKDLAFTQLNNFEDTSFNIETD